MTKIHRYADIPFHVPPVDPADLDLDTPAAPDQPGRKFLAQGEGGFYSQAVRIPPHFEGPVHAHDHAEVFLVLEGRCSFNGEPLVPFDSTVVEANQPYGFATGPEGVTFLVVRQAKARFLDV
jgi:quercetin dioxygenase-like cupin family protein